MVNITMLVRNRPRLTMQALESLEGIPHQANISILDDRSDKAAYDLVYNWCDRVGAAFMRTSRSPGTGLARNMVINLAQETFGRGDYLYLSDNDVKFSPGWLSTLIACYEQARKYGFMVVGAYNHPYHQPVGVPVTVDVVRRPPIPAMPPTATGVDTKPVFVADKYEVREVQALALQSMLMRWDVWDEYGPFCATPVDKVCQSEDVDFARKIKAHGGKLGVVSPPLLVNTGITNSFGEKIPGWEAVLKEAPAGVIVE